MGALIMALYFEPEASVVNGVVSERFKLRNGTRQGCPLSPLIFVLALEPLLSMIRANPSIGGIQVGAVIHKLAAYADDLIFFISHPVATIPNLLYEFQRYGAIAGYKINMQKSEALGITLSVAERDRLAKNFAFSWAQTAIKYLGIRIPADPKDVYKMNYIVT